MTETLERPQANPAECMKVEPSPEHRWLQRLVGAWSFEAECSMGPGQPSAKSHGRQTNRMLGDLWLIGEGEGDTPTGDPMNSIITLGYDPVRAKFVGTFVASVMTHLWPYEGTLDGDVLTLDSEGPSFAGDGTLAKYQDIFEIVDDDHWILRSRAPGPDGQRFEFMTAHYRRAR